MQLQQQQQQQHRRHCHSSSSSRFVACMSHSVASPRFSRPFNCHMASCTQTKRERVKEWQLCEASNMLPSVRCCCVFGTFQGAMSLAKTDTKWHNYMFQWQRRTLITAHTHTGSAGMQHELSSPKGMTSLVSLAWPGNCIFGYISLTFWAAIKNEQKWKTKKKRDKHGGRGERDNCNCRRNSRRSGGAKGRAFSQLWRFR